MSADGRSSGGSDELLGMEELVLRGGSPFGLDLGPQRPAPGDGAAGPGRPSDYDEVFQRVLSTVVEHEAAFARERATAPGLLAELRRQPPARRKLLLRNSRKFQSWALCQLLIETSHELGFKDPAESCEYARLATEVAERLDRSHYGSGPCEDLNAAAWAQMGNALRVVTDLRQAEEAFATAERYLEGGTGDPLERARWLDLKASLRRAQARWEESLELLDEAISYYREVGDRRQEARALIKKSISHGEAGDTEIAIRLARQALDQIDPSEDSRLAAVAYNSLLTWLTESGRYLEAQVLLARTRRLYRRAGWETGLLALRWEEGFIALRLGRFAEAEEALLEAREGYIEKGVGYRVALISLDLATLYARQGRTAEMKTLARQMVPIFQSRDVHQEALAALLIFQQAVEAESVSLGLVEEVAAYLRRAQHNPGLRFQGTSTS